MVFEETPISDRRSIPPISRPTDARSDATVTGWLPIVLACSVAAVVLTVWHFPGSAAHHPGSFVDAEKARPLLITEVARPPVFEASPSGAARTGAVVPGSAVVRVRGAPVVFVSEKDYRFVATPVVLGETNTEGQRVVSGISAGQVVVSDGAEALKARLVLQ